MEGSTWDRLVHGIAHPVRWAAWSLALGVTLGPFGGLPWVAAGASAAVGGGILGEVLGRSRLRLPVVGASLLGLVVLGLVLQRILTTYALVPGVLGTTASHAIAQLVHLVALGVAVLAGLRAAAVRGPAFQVVELAGLGALLAGAVASHRDGSIARPLWLSDLCWSFGVDPGHVLLAGGTFLTALLASLLLLGTDRRKPAAGLLVLPLLAVLALALSTLLPALEPPDPVAIRGMDVEEGDGEGGQGGTPDDADSSKGEGSGKPDETDGDGKGSPKDDPPDPMDGGGAGGQNRPIAVVLLDDDHVPPSGYWYLRQDVLPDYNGSRMVPSTEPGTHQDVLDHFPSEPEQLDLPLLDLRKTLNGTVSLVVDHPTPFAPETARAFAPRGNPDPARFKRSYHFTSTVFAADLASLVPLEAGDSEWPDTLRDHYLEAPEDPRYRELADQILDDLLEELPPGTRPTPFMKALAVVLWMGDNMRYSRAYRHAGVPDPTADFLFGNRIGYCVHTAHASVYLWRLLGIPARVATGYAVEESTRRGSALVVMAGDAHAWPELYLEGVGWVPLDVSPAENLENGQGLPPDEEELRALGELARHAPDLPEPRPDRRWITTLLARIVVLGLFALLLAVLLGHWGVKMWWLSRPRWAPAKSLPRVGYRAALEQLAEAGLPREEGETREAYARRLEAIAPSLGTLTDLHLRGTLGRPAEADPEHDRIQWTGQLARLRHELQQHTPWWRRLVGLVDPSTPYRAR